MLLANISNSPLKNLSERGRSFQLLNPSRGCARLDFRVNELDVGCGPGPYHYHSNADNIYYVLDGEALVTIDSTEHTLKPGDAVLILQGERHDIENRGDAPLRFIEVKVPADSDFVDVEAER